jgi:hypothetical protein
VVTSTAHGLKPGDKIPILAGTLTEMTELNGAGYTIFNVTDNTFQLFEVGTDTVVDSSTYAAETTGGSGVKVNNPNPWIFEGYLSFQGTDDLVLSWRGYDRSNTMMGVEQISETTGADLDIEVTATLEHASDTVSMDLFTVEGR